jgi:hypothetical protein
LAPISTRADTFFKRQEGSDTAPIMFILGRLPPHCSLPA